MNDLPRTREKALKEKSLYYFTGKPCKRGHVGERLTSDKNCYLCKLFRGEMHRQSNRAKYAEKMRNRRKRRGDEIRSKERLRYKSNPYRIRAEAALRRAYTKRAFPKWASLEAIKQFYKNCPHGYEVDHIIPLRGKTVCGLHTVENLQYLTKEENRRKNNNFKQEN